MRRTKRKTYTRVMLTLLAIGLFVAIVVSVVTAGLIHRGWKDTRELRRKWARQQQMQQDDEMFWSMVKENQLDL